MHPLFDGTIIPSGPSKESPNACVIISLNVSISIFSGKCDCTSAIKDIMKTTSDFQDSGKIGSKLFHEWDLIEGDKFRTGGR